MGIGGFERGVERAGGGVEPAEPFRAGQPDDEAHVRPSPAEEAREPVHRFLGRDVHEQIQRVKPLRQRLMDGEAEDISLDDGVDTVDKAHDLADIGEFHMVGPVWTLICDNDQTHRLIADVDGILGTMAAIVPVAAPYIAAAIGYSTAYIEGVNWLGGNNGVEITGVIGQQGLLVIPRGVTGLFRELIEAAKIVMAGATVLDWVVAAAAYSPAIANAGGIAAVGSMYNLISSGTPYGWALAAAAGLAIEALQSEPDPDEHGHVAANRGQAQDWESFLVQSLGGDQVSLLSHVGFLSARGGGGSAVFANRPQVGDWERWHLLDNGDGTISLRSFNGNYFTAEGGGGRECNSDRPAIGYWEKFVREALPDGRFALKAHISGQYVSIQP